LITKLVEIAKVVVIELSKLVVSLAGTEDVGLLDVQIILFLLRISLLIGPNKCNSYY